MVGTLELSNLVNIHSSARKLLKFLLALPIKGYGKEQEKYITDFENFHSSCIGKTIRQGNRTSGISVP